MSDKIQKFLSKLNAKERQLVAEIVSAILAGQTAHLDITRLKGSKSIYRVRKGNICLIFYKRSDDEIRFLQISRRNEKTYRNF